MAENVNPVQASKSVLVEVMNVLGLYRNHLTLVGGWVPDLLFPNCGHRGTLDVDLAVDVRGISQKQYDTILQRLLDAGYAQEAEANGFLRSVKGAQEPVKLHLITGQYVDDTASGIPARFQEIRLGKLRGTDLAFEFCDEISLNGEMPDGGKNTVKLRIVKIEAFIVMKAFAMAEREKITDAYDIYFCLRHFPDGVAALTKLYGPILHNGLVQEGIQVLRDKFRTIDTVGPEWAAQVVAEQYLGDPELAQREAFELMTSFLAAIAEKWAPQGPRNTLGPASNSA